MLNEVTNFISEMESTYIKELDPNIVLNFLEKFYKDFIKKNYDMESTLLHKTANAIVVCADAMMLKKSQVKDQWIYKTGENYILHTNRGNETFDKLVKDILDGYVINEEVIRVVQILFFDIDSEYKMSFTDYINKRSPLVMNVSDNLLLSNLNKLKKPAYKFLHMGLSFAIITLFFTELYYLISLYGTVKSTEDLLNSIRSIYVF